GFRFAARPERALQHVRQQPTACRHGRFPQRAVSVRTAMLCLNAFGSHLRRRLGGFSCDQRGVSAVEFALLLPRMVTLYLGTVEVSQGISVDRKLTMTARTLADLVSQSTTINNSSMTDILNASTAVMYPYATGSLKATVSSISIDANSKATVAWSDSYNGT